MLGQLWMISPRPVSLKNRPPEAVTISTIHSAKGLEWHTVFIPHVLDDLLPSYRNLDSLEGLEEELRVFYAAATRARENLFISMPAYVYKYSAVYDKPSRFIKEAERKCYEADNNDARKFDFNLKLTYLL